MSQPGRWRKRVIKLSISLLLTLLLLEVGARIFLMKVANISPFHPSHAIYGFYQKLQFVEQASVTEDNGQYDIMMLGGSVMQGAFDQAKKPNSLKALKPLIERYGKQIRPFSVAQGGLTSLDSRYLLERLKEKKFDLVILYQAINEVRANNCPDDVFKEDYSHYAPYPILTPLVEGRSPDFALDTLGRFLWSRLVLEANGTVVPKENPREEWLDYGDKIKTGPAYEKNVREIIRIARAQGAEVLLVTFAYYVPDGYTDAKFEQEALDYSKTDADPWRFPIGQWGKPANVTKGIDVHNAVLRAIAKEEAGASDLQLIDLAADFDALPNKRDYFTDVCHLSHKGYEHFFGLLVPAILKSIEASDRLEPQPTPEPAVP